MGLRFNVRNEPSRVSREKKSEIVGRQIKDELAWRRARSCVRPTFLTYLCKKCQILKIKTLLIKEEDI